MSIALFAKIERFDERSKALPALMKAHLAVLVWHPTLHDCHRSYNSLPTTSFHFLHAGTPMGSRPASMDYGRRDMPLQGIAENRNEGVGAHPVTFDSGSEMGSEMGSRPGSEPASPRAGARVRHSLLTLRPSHAGWSYASTQRSFEPV